MTMMMMKGMKTAIDLGAPGLCRRGSVCPASSRAPPCASSSRRWSPRPGCTCGPCTSSSARSRGKGLPQTGAPASPCASGSRDLSHRTCCTLSTLTTLTVCSPWLEGRRDRELSTRNGSTVIHHLCHVLFHALHFTGDLHVILLELHGKPL
ncbi:hypothetical protein AAFF_G00382970 [Aldrovandia affinis]|uniref:Uncharacterized protein n=1 Tax=Aldrovandia affinis TaxID=143900 RepID=A0AAD7T8G8_9TELE|nr:hypothetical protein AAFF_G00382970 [Aldrovandia affinis]